MIAERGFQVFLQSCRGTAGSGGEFVPEENEQRDGIATVRWLRAQPWCDGTIATAGMSYLGYTQYATATAPGTDIAAMALSVTMADLGEPTFASGSITLSGTLGWAQNLSFGTDSARGGGRLRSLVAAPRAGARARRAATRVGRSHRERPDHRLVPGLAREPLARHRLLATHVAPRGTAVADRPRVHAHRMGRPVPSVDAA